MNSTIYIQTSDPKTLIAIAKTGDSEAYTVSADTVPVHAFNLTNTLKVSAMAEVRSVAKANGLRLRDVKTMAIQ